MAVKAFIFDIGGVLLDFDLDALAARIADGRPEIVPRVHALRDDPSLIEVETGRMSGRHYFDRYIRPLAPTWSYGDLVQVWVDVFSRNERGQRLFADLRRQRHPVYLLSNLASFNAEAIAQKYPSFFDASSGNFFSFELGCVKPEPEIYRKVTSRIGAAPAECLFLDDTMECVEGARRAGLQALLFAASQINGIRRAVARALGERTGPARGRGSAAARGFRPKRAGSPA